MCLRFRSNHLTPKLGDGLHIRRSQNVLIAVLIVSSMRDALWRIAGHRVHKQDRRLPFRKRLLFCEPMAVNVAGWADRYISLCNGANVLIESSDRSTDLSGTVLSITLASRFISSWWKDSERRGHLAGLQIHALNYSCICIRRASILVTYPGRASEISS